jgi:hypothetical protein
MFARKESKVINTRMTKACHTWIVVTGHDLCFFCFYPQWVSILDPFDVAFEHVVGDFDGRGRRRRRGGGVKQGESSTSRSVSSQRAASMQGDSWRNILTDRSACFSLTEVRKVVVERERRWRVQIRKFAMARKLEGLARKGRTDRIQVQK